MPTVTNIPAKLFAFCPQPRCPGYRCQEVDGVAQEISRTAFEEAGPMAVNGNAVLTSHFRYFVPSDEVDESGNPVAQTLVCEHCGRDKQIANEPRPRYARMSNQSQRRLLELQDDAGLDEELL